MKEEVSFKKLSAIASLAILGILTLIILWPIASAIVSGLVVAYVFNPVHKRVLSVVKEKNISALIIILLVVLLICVPLWFLLPIIVKQIFDIYLFLQNVNFLDIFRRIFPSLSRTEFTVDFASSLNSFISGIANRIFSSVSDIFLNLPNFILKAAVMFFVFFFAMRDSESLIKYVKTLSPFSKRTEADVIRKFKGITNSVLYGFIIVGIIQGLLTGFGLFIFQVPQALLLTLLSIFAAMIPILGSWVIWVPAVLYLLLTGHILLGFSLLAYGSLLVSWVDNIIRPYIVAKKVKISSAIVLIGMIGGLIMFGILGFIIGPLVLSYLLLILDAYRKNKLPSLFSG